MEHEFWHTKWRKGEIGFHQQEVNPLLARYLDTLPLSNNSRVFVPLCGKTLDIHWLLKQGYQVTGVELNELAIQQLFGELDIKPTIVNDGKVKRYISDRLDVFIGDIFDVSQTMLENIDLIYDRAALIALPFSMRKNYTSHLMNISNKASQLLVCLEYDQALIQGPPFSVDRREVEQHYQYSYQINLLASETIPEKLKNKVVAREAIWWLK